MQQFNIIALCITLVPFAAAYFSCTPPGEYTCAVIVSDSVASVGIDQPYEGTGFDVVGGSCAEIGSGSMDGQGIGKGFHGHTDTSYGPSVDVWVDSFDFGGSGIQDVRMVYNTNPAEWVWDWQCTRRSGGFVSCTFESCPSWTLKLMYD